jgi:hypothetical protein
LFKIFGKIKAKIQNIRVPKKPSKRLDKGPARAQIAIPLFGFLNCLISTGTGLAHPK